MCGRLNVIDDGFIQIVLAGLEVDNPQTLHQDPFITPCHQLSIVVEEQGRRQLKQALWWLLLEATEQGYKPSRYTSFNTRYDKLNVPGSAGFQPFRSSRCVIAASGFGETQFVNKKPVSYHDMRAINGALLFGGLYRTWLNPATGEVSYSCSVITNPPHPKFANIHTKASPLILPQDTNVLDAWLDPDNHQVGMFEPLLTPRIPCDLMVQQIDKPSRRNPLGEPFMIPAD